MKIKLLIIVLLSSIFFTFCSSLQSKIPYSKLNRNIKIVGSLGFPLGSIITIEGIAVTKNRIKKYSGKILLKVYKINNENLIKPVVILYSTLSFVDIKKIKKGEKFKLIGYETGSYKGVPNKAFKYIPVASTSEFSFNLSFVVIKKMIND